jgi:hypothetical protein
MSEQEQRRFFDVAAEGVHVFRADGTVDDSVVTTAGDDEAMTDDDLVVFVDHRLFGDGADA